MMKPRFAHSTPALYDRYMGPLLFEPCANAVASRVAVLQPNRILEVAAGTGIVTRAVHGAVPAAQIIATDINPALLEYAKATLTSSNVSWEPADAQNLPFPSESFNLVLCQFGIMFFPDKVLANREARRVLCSNGKYLLVTFNALELNPIPKVAEDAVNVLFPNDPIKYMENGPFCYGEKAKIECDLVDAGFMQIEIETMNLSSRVNCQDAAQGLVYGSPLRAEIAKRDGSALDRAAEAVAEALEVWDGKDAPMSVHIVSARNGPEP